MQERPGSQGEGNMDGFRMLFISDGLITHFLDKYLFETHLRADAIFTVLKR